jgi:hypothetical protein
MSEQRSSLAVQLAVLEKQAKEHLENQVPPYSRELLEAETNIKKSTLKAWLDDGRRPQDVENVLKVVRGLSNLAGNLPVDDDKWRRVHADAGRRDSGPVGKRARWRKLRKRWWALIGTGVASGVGIIVASILTSAASPVGTNIDSHVFPQSSPSSTIEASASWCCTYVGIESYTNGYYTPGSISTLTSQLSGGAIPKNPDITGAGTAVVEITVQTSDPEPILVGPPQIQILSRKPNVSAGTIGFVTVTSQGSGAPADFKTALDDAQPVTVPWVLGGSGQAGLSTADAYYYVSSGSLQPLILVVDDNGCDCTFDVKLNWKAEGQEHSTVLENGKQPFHMVGAAGLSWYGENVVKGQGFTPLTGSSVPTN